jgi:hypothetical protein
MKPKVKKGKVTEIPSKRLKKVFEAKNVERLFGLLKGWSLAELQALQSDVGLFHEATVRQIDAVAKSASKELFKGKNTKLIRASIVEAKKQVNFKLMTICAEILSVTLYFIREREEGR